MPKKFWEIRNSATDENVGEVLIYGPLANQTWWNDEVTPVAFNNDLDELGAKNELHVRINSYGGDVFAGHAIHNSIKNYKRKHEAEIKIFIDGIAASAASTVAMAGDVIVMPANTMMMIHDPMIGLCGYVNKDELLKYIDILDPIKESIIAAYHEKTGNDKSEIDSDMSKETWMTAEQAIEKGYADVMSDEIDLDIEMNNQNIISINNVELDCRRFVNMPTQFKNIAKKPKVSNVQGKKEEAPMKPDEIKNKHSESYSAIVNDAAKAERERIKEIQDLALPGNEELVKNAIDSGMAAGEFAIAQTRAEKIANESIAEKVKNDAEKVSVNPAGDDEITEDEKEDFEAKNMADYMNGKK